MDASQVLALVNELKRRNCLDCLKLLHFHLGSEMSNIRDITKGVRESAMFFGELSKLGAHLEYFDVGGGLGVDYEGTRTQSDCSVNYGLKEYANNVVFEIAEVCKRNSIPEPTIITESGRAVAAYHAVLVTNTVGVERYDSTTPPEPATGTQSQQIAGLYSIWNELQKDDSEHSLREEMHDAQSALQEVHDGYVAGAFSLSERARAEQLYLSILRKIESKLEITANRSHRQILEEIQRRLADKIYLNFSLFQSLPDAWGIGQIFPVVPLDGLDRPLTRRAVLLDITCDSDGAIKQYVDGDDIESTMPFPEYDPEKPPFIGFFMIGAYQEILGCMHNLMGDTEVLEITVSAKGETKVRLADEGSTVADMLRYVLLDPSKLLAEFSSQVLESDLDEGTQRELIDEFKAGLFNYTYLTTDIKE